MQLHILAIGRAKKTPQQQLVDEFMGRLPRKGKVVEAESRLPSGPARQADESQKLLAACQQSFKGTTKLIAMDPHGTSLSSEALAALISQYRDAGTANLCFAIGGADGHDKALLDEADKVISFGAATWPHMLFRAMLAEQLYRAEMIIANHPYHKS